MEENEELEQEGSKVTEGEENGNSGIPDRNQEDTSLPTDGPVSQTEGDDSRPDLTDTEKNEDSGPDVATNGL